MAAQTIYSERGQTVQTQESNYRDAVAHVAIGYAGAHLDREATVRLIDALTTEVERHDVEEAQKAAKLKAGDKVMSENLRGMTYLVLSDEDASGRVDVVSLHPGATVYEGKRAELFRLLERPRRAPGARRFNGADFVSARAPF